MWGRSEGEFQNVLYFAIFNVSIGVTFDVPGKKAQVRPRIMCMLISTHDFLYPSFFIYRYNMSTKSICRPYTWRHAIFEGQNEAHGTHEVDFARVCSRLALYPTGTQISWMHCWCKLQENALASHFLFCDVICLRSIRPVLWWKYLTRGNVYKGNAIFSSYIKNIEYLPKIDTSLYISRQGGIVHHIPGLGRTL